MPMDFERYKKMNDEKENYREMEGATVDHVYHNDACGDGYHIFLKVSPQGLIEDASYTTTGCGFGLAALAVVTKLVKGKTLAEAEGVGPADIEADFEFPEKRRNYPVTAVEAMRQTLAQAREKLAVH
ncbi:MAG TPA: iron-sulfur cluster assembly scaffold protein [bacterium]|jgi:NifU-like protein involved in Fe-S cluster formation|nr:iron-sulfur cluster assembly scaffold protein [bacterium]